MLKQFLSLFLKPNCPLCQRPTGEIICQYCARRLRSCQLDDPQILWRGELPVFVWGRYANYLKQAIASFKYDLHEEIGELLGMWLAQGWLSSALVLPASKIAVVPIPLHPQRLKKRGFNQAAVIARRFCQITGYGFQPNLLERVRDTEAMFGLNPSQRKENIAGVFQAGKDFSRFNRASSVLILDDIYTTGTTVREASRVLRSHSIQVLGVVAIATPAPHSPSLPINPERSIIDTERG